MQGNSTVTDDQQGTDVRRFLLTRGHLLLKEFKPIGNVPCSYGQRIDATVLTLSVGDSGSSSKTHGLRLQEIRPDGETDGSNYLDADELAEMIDAIHYIRDAASSMRGQRRDYTEAIYVSKDGVKLGFYQDEGGDQNGFIDVDGDGRMVFFPVDTLGSIADLISRASHFIESKRSDSSTDTSLPHQLGSP